MIYNLKLDYDSRYIINRWKNSVNRIYRVYYDKRDYLPEICVDKVTISRKGIHIFLKFSDGEKTVKNIVRKRLSVVLLQSIFDSDQTRSLFDYLRIQRNMKNINLMFEYKSGRNNVESQRLREKLNVITAKVKQHYENRRSLI